MMCIEDFKAEFQMRNLGFSHHRPDLFVRLQCGPNVLYIIWVSIWTVYHVTMIVLDAIWTHEEIGYPSALWLIYLTNWSYFLLTFMTVWDLITVILTYTLRRDLHSNRNPGQDKDQDDAMSWYHKALWILYTVAWEAALAVTIGYWSYGIVFNPAYIQTTVSSFNTHLVNGIYAFLHLMVSAKPIRLLHFYLFTLYGVVYMSFSYIYLDLSENAIYPPTNWKEAAWKFPVALFAAILAAIVTHCTVFTFVTIRQWIAKKCNSLNVVEEGNTA